MLSRSCGATPRPEGPALDIATTPIPATTSTGAGDAFAAGFLYALLGPGSAARDAATLRRAALAGHRERFGPAPPAAADRSL